MQPPKIIAQFDKIALLEGWSYVLLLFIAMPVKYYFSNPMPVKYLGWAHGVLFIFYMIWLTRCAISLSWKIEFVLWAVVAAFIPFGTFLLHQQLSNRYR